MWAWKGQLCLMAGVSRGSTGAGRQMQSSPKAGGELWHAAGTAPCRAALEAGHTVPPWGCAVWEQTGTVAPAGKCKNQDNFLLQHCKAWT